MYIVYIYILDLFYSQYILYISYILIYNDCVSKSRIGHVLPMASREHKCVMDPAVLTKNRANGGFHSHGGTPNWMVYKGTSHENG